MRQFITFLLIVGVFSVSLYVALSIISPEYLMQQINAIDSAVEEEVLAPHHKRGGNGYKSKEEAQQNCDGEVEELYSRNQLRGWTCIYRKG